MSDLYIHEKQDKIKWIVTFIALGLLFIMVLGLVISVLLKERVVEETKEQNTGIVVAIDNDGNRIYDNQLYEMPLLLYLQETENVEDDIISEFELFANVQPENATNKEVDFSLSWHINTIDSELLPEEFVFVEQIEDGDQRVKITILKEFPNSSIVLTATTRDGGYTASCILLYLGTANSIEVINSFISSTYVGYTELYQLLPNTTFEFDLNLTTVGGFEAKKVDIEFSLSTSGDIFYVGNCFQDPESGITNYYEDQFRTLTLDEMLPKIVEEIWIENNKLYIKMGEMYLETYSSSKEIEEMVGMHIYDKFVGPWDIATGEAFETYSAQNMETLQNAYIYVTVTEKISGIGYGFYIYHGSKSFMLT